MRINTLKAIFAISFVTLATTSFARQVPLVSAKVIAENFYAGKAGKAVTAELKYSTYDQSGNALFHVFSVKGETGFVIVSAEDAALPIIGYSTQDNFEKPQPGSNLGNFLSRRETEISYLRQNNIPANAAIFVAWEKYSSSVKQSNKSANVGAVAPLLSTRWNQSPYYNDSCPGGSVTGCVATTMAQIMRYWAYPNQGTGNSSYNSGYGVLKAHYGSATYNWNAMPDVITGPNPDVAEINYHCGVSVNMNYSPQGSGAWVIKADNTISAENSFTSYFGYDPALIKGYRRDDYSDGDWLAMLHSDLDAGHPVEYVGWGDAGGHTWVCDGYDQNDMFHMNWGWGGSGNGYFSINSLNVNGMDFTNGQECIFGIVPMAHAALDAGAVSVTPLNNVNCVQGFYSPVFKLRNYGTASLASCKVNYVLDNGQVQTINWSGSLSRGQATDIPLNNFTLSSGSHTFTCYISDPNNGADGYSANNQIVYTFNVFSVGSIPLVEGFEDPALTGSQWVMVPSGGSDWMVTGQAFSGGEKSVMINNLTNTPGNTSIYTGLKNYDLFSALDPFITFKVAYQQKSANNNDKLSLEMSNDCGQTWWTRWTKQGSALATTTVLSNTPFVPSANDFVEYNITAPISSNAIFRWVFKADATNPGNNVYLDDINLLDATVGLKKINGTASGIELFPNPSNGETNLRFQLAGPTHIAVNVFDISGRKLISLEDREYAAGEQTIRFNQNSELSKGIYLVNIRANGTATSYKLVMN